MCAMLFFASASPNEEDTSIPHHQDNGVSILLKFLTTENFTLSDIQLTSCLNIVSFVSVVSSVLHFGLMFFFSFWSFATSESLSHHVVEITLFRLIIVYESFHCSKLVTHRWFRPNLETLFKNGDDGKPSVAGKSSHLHVKSKTRKQQLHSYFIGFR